MGSLVVCRGCGSTNLRTFLNLGSTPLADAFPVTPDEPQPRYPLGLTLCVHCWLVQNSETVPDSELWTEDYGFYTGASPSSIAYFEDYAAWVRERCPDPAFVVEIASNDGTLLRHFREARVLGVEPAGNVARASGLPVIIAPFGRAVARGIEEPADLILANNVIAHVDDLQDFVGGIAELLAPDGIAVIEFQYVADLLLGNQFDHVYHEHRSFFSLRSLSGVVARHGLRVAEAIRTPAQGGSLRVVVRHGDDQSVEPPELNYAESWLRHWSTYETFEGRVLQVRDRIRALVRAEREAGRRVAGYAASAKSATLLNYCDLGPDDIVAVVDKTPSKIGRFTPGTGIPIVEQTDADTYLLLAWNYLPGVIRRERSFLDHGGRIIVPIPVPMVL